jgi:two-component system phosphate regulon sensor histidine kinase PhoR
MRLDLITAFASHNDRAVRELAPRLPHGEEFLWLRLITARNAEEESGAVRERARRDLEDVLASLQDAVLVIDSDSRLRFLNAAALRLFEVRIEEVLGANLVEALPSFGLDQAMREALREGTASAREVHLYAPRMREVFLRVAPITSAPGQTTGAVAVVQDLTELRRLERVRRDFVANASHELRTPIANIRATAETLLHSEDDPTLIKRFLPSLVEEAERLSRLVTDLLELARAEALEEQPTDTVELVAVINGVVERMRRKSARRHVGISWNAPPAPVYVQGDAAGMEQVLFNLLDNALSYPPPQGQGTLTLRQEPGGYGTEAGGPSKAILTVQDTGIGIPEADLDRVFERFYRVDKARSRAEGGTGLGLAIVKHVVEMHGGHVQVESRVGEGTTFRLELPGVTP